VYQHTRLDLEKHLATARRALYRAQATAEMAALYEWEEDLRLINDELAKLMAELLPAGGAPSTRAVPRA